MANKTITTKLDHDETFNKELIRRHISIYMLYCEGRRCDEIAEAFDISKTTVYKDIKWCRENLPTGFTEVLLDDMIFDTIRRRAILWSRFKKLSKVDISTNHLVSVSCHILELDKKILEWKNILHNKLEVEHSIKQESLEDVLSRLDDLLKGMSNKELEAIVARGYEKEK